MAFIKTCLKPNVSYLSASGNPCTFNTGLGGHGKDLQKCVVSFMATQSGSGTPSPYNERPIIPVNSVAVNFSGIAISKALGADYGGGYIDLLTGKAYITHVVITPTKGQWQGKDGNYFFSKEYNNITNVQNTSGLSNKFGERRTGVSNIDTWWISSSRRIVIYPPTSYATVGDMYDAIGEMSFVCLLATPITIQLTPTQLTQIASQNTITGGAEIINIEVNYLRIGPTSVSGMAESFKIPEVSYPEVSGAIASFNTDFALPLKNGEFSIEAYQEGSGDPSPDNVRNIVPWTSQGITRCGNNLINGVDIANLLVANGATINTQTGIVRYGGSVARATGVFFDKFKPNTQYTLMFELSSNSAQTLNAQFIYTDDSSSNINGATGELLSRTSAEGKSLKAISFTWVTGTTELKYNNFGIFDGNLSAASFEAYDGETKTVSFGQDVYGGIYNSVTGVKRIDYDLIDLGSLTWEKDVTYPYRFKATIPTLKLQQVVRNAWGMCSEYKFIYNREPFDQIPDKSAYFGWADISNNVSYRVIFIHDNDYINDDAITFKAAVNGVKVVYPLQTPIETDIGATPISTNIGINNIFCDTGDSKVQYIKVSP